MSRAQRSQRRPGEADRGILLLRGELDSASRWVERGLVAAYVLPLSGWIGVLPAEPASRAMPPYDQATTLLAARPAGQRMRPSIALFTSSGRSIVSIQPAGWRAVQRWLVWSPGQGIVRTPRLPVARPRDLLAAAGAASRGAAQPLGKLLRQPRGDALGWLVDLMRVLGLPGERLLTGEDDVAPVSRLIEPRESTVARFEAILRDEAEHLAELEET